MPKITSMPLFDSTPAQFERTQSVLWRRRSESVVFAPFSCSKIAISRGADGVGSILLIFLGAVVPQTGPSPHPWPAPRQIAGSPAPPPDTSAPLAGLPPPAASPHGEPHIHHSVPSPIPVPLRPPLPWLCRICSAAPTNSSHPTRRRSRRAGVCSSSFTVRPDSSFRAYTLSRSTPPPVPMPLSPIGDKGFFRVKVFSLAEAAE